MKKYMIAALLIGSSMFAMADGHNENEFLEKRIENRLKTEITDIKGDYDVDLYKDMASVEIEVDSNKNVNFDPIATKIANIVKEESGISDTTVSVELDKMVGKDEIIYNKRFK